MDIMQSISPAQLADVDNSNNILLIDVREEWEHEAFNIGGINIPLSELGIRKNEIPRDKEIVVYCEKGIRSVIAIQRLEQEGFTNLINLNGGVYEWKRANS